MAPGPLLPANPLPYFVYAPEAHSVMWFFSAIFVYVTSYFLFPSLHTILSFSFVFPSFLSFLFCLAVIFLPSKLFSLGGSFDGAPQNLPNDTVALITGTSAGLGFESAVQLLKRGAKVIALMRGTPSKHNEVLAAIAAKAGKSYPNELLKSVEIDLTSFSSILSAAQQIYSTVSWIDILLNNAGVMALPQRELTKDGLELQLGTNHFGHFLLTSLLIPLLQKSHWKNGSRVVNVSSLGHTFSQELSQYNIQLASSVEGYHPRQMYGMSKLANIYFTQQLEAIFGCYKKNSEDGLGPIHSYAAHPGAVITELARYIPGFQHLKPLHFFFQCFLKLPSQGVLTQLYCCISSDKNLIAGQYYADCKLSKSTPLSQNREKCKSFWKLSETMTADILSKLLGKKIEPDFQTWHNLIQKK